MRIFLFFYSTSIIPKLYNAMINNFGYISNSCIQNELMFLAHRCSFTETVYSRHQLPTGVVINIFFVIT